MKLPYAPAILSFVALASFGSQSLASAGQAEPAVSPDGESAGVTLQTEPLFGILSGMMEPSMEPNLEPTEEPNIAEAPEGDMNRKLEGDDPRGWHGFYCPPCGRG